MLLQRFGVLLAAALLAGVAGCGEGGGPLSHAELVKRADAACRDAVRRITATGSPQSLRELGRIGGHQVDLAEDVVDRIAGLHPPAADRAAHRRLVEALRRAIVFDRRVVSDAAHADVRALASDGAAADAARTRARSAADRLGAQACATAPPA